MAGGGHRAEHGGAIVVGGSPGGGCRFRAGGSDATEVAWASRSGRAGCQRRGNNPLERHRYHRLAPAMVLVEPLHGLTFALLHPACMQMLFVIIPRALAATDRATYGAVAVGAMSAILSLVSGPLDGVFGARAFWAMALHCAPRCRSRLRCAGSRSMHPGRSRSNRYLGSREPAERSRHCGNGNADAHRWLAIRH